MNYIFGKVVLKNLNGQPIWPISQKCIVISYSDASSWGWGGCVVQVGGSMSKGIFSKFEAGKVPHGGSYRVLSMF